MRYGGSALAYYGRCIRVDRIAKAVAPALRQLRDYFCAEMSPKNMSLMSLTSFAHSLPTPKLISRMPPDHQTSIQEYLIKRVVDSGAR